MQRRHAVAPRHRLLQRSRKLQEQMLVGRTAGDLHPDRHARKSA